ncbi:unnamed protein product [Linum trigynum]|uniref:Uncharacterized protein n=1 Tax=Linum trigynum TaxID=586398 RepID=A0AAV2FPD1_9ROSI
MGQPGQLKSARRSICRTQENDNVFVSNKWDPSKRLMWPESPDDGELTSQLDSQTGQMNCRTRVGRRMGPGIRKPDCGGECVRQLEKLSKEVEMVGK